MLFSTLHETVASVFRPPHTQFHESLRLQFPFVFRRLQSLQLLLPARPYPLRFLRFTSLGFHFHGRSPLPLLFLTPAVFASFRPLQFWVLTTQPLCFLSLLPASAPQWLPQRAALAFAPSALPALSRLVSHALDPRFRYSAPLFVSFRPSSLRSHSCSTSADLSFRPRSFPLPLRSLSLASRPVPATQPPVLPFSSPAVPPHKCFPARRLRSRFRGFPVLSSPLSRAFLPGSLTRPCCPFPFVLPCFAPAAVPQVIPFRISSPGPVPDFRFPSASFRPLSSRFRFSISLLSLCFFLSAIPASASQWLPQFPIPLSLPRSPPSVTPGLPHAPSGFPYSASCSFPFALP